MCVGNKMDLPKPTRAEDEKAAEAWCAAHGVGLLFASACDGTGVAVAMEAVAALALENKKRRQALGVTKPPSLSLDDLHAREKRGSSNCC